MSPLFPLMLLAAAKSSDSLPPAKSFSSLFPDNTDQLPRKNRTKRAAFLSIALFSVLWLTTGRIELFAQVDVATATIKGKVTDQLEATVSGATVSVVDTARGVVRSSKSDGQGNYQLSVLPPGTYELRTEAAGFQSQVLQNVVLTVGQVVVHDLKLQIGDLKVAVTASAIPMLIETARTQQSDTIERNQIANLPNISRHFNAYVFTLSGVADTEAARVQQTRVLPLRTSGFSVGGSNGRSNYISIDGGENDSGIGGLRVRNLSVEAVQEFQVNLNAFAAEFGFTSGTAANVVTRGGTNGFHGSGYIFYRSEKTAARNPLNQNGHKAHERRVIPGFTFGGQLIRNKAFFFTSLENNRYDIARVRAYTSDPSLLQPTDAQTSYLQTLEAGPNATTTTRGIAAQLRNALSTFSYPTTMQILRDSEGQFIAPSRAYNWTTRLDYNRSERDSKSLQGRT